MAAVITALHPYARTPKHAASDLWACPDCGSTKVQASVWVNANTLDVEQSNDQWYCPDCDAEIQHMVRQSELTE